MKCTHNALPVIILFIVLCAFVIPVSAAGTQTPLTFNSNQHTLPAVDGDWVAWEELKGSSNTIHAYNLVTGREYTLPHSYAYSNSPFIQGNRIVWTEDNTTGFQDLFWCNLPPGAAHYVPAPESTKINPVIYGNKIVWQDKPPGAKNDVLMYDISNSRISNLAPDAPADTNQQYPGIYGDLVVWEDRRNTIDWDIWMNDTRPGIWKQKQLVLDPANQSFDQRKPAIAGDLIVFEDNRNGFSDIYLYRNSLDTELGNLTPTDDSAPQNSPEISGDKVIWLDNILSSGYKTIGMYNASTGTGYQPPVADATHADTIRISGNRVVWSEIRSGNSHIYLYTDGISKSCPIPHFTADPVSGSPGLLVNFTDQSVVPADNPITHYYWDFRDTTSSVLQNPSQRFTTAGTFPVSLTVSNALCRNTTPLQDQYNITIGPPTARFTVTPRIGLIPLTVVVTDTSVGAPDAWNWSFGDGTYAETSTATHTYTTRGTFIIRLNVSNPYGTSSAQVTVFAREGTNENAYTTINGLSFQNTGGQQRVILHYDILTDWSFLPNASVLEFTPPADRGFANITLYSFDGTGFRQYPASHTVRGNVTGARLQSREMVLEALSPEIGPESSFNFTLYHSQYPVGATLNTQVWEGMTSADFLSFTDIASHTGYGHLSGTAYTVKITKTNLPPGVTARLHMSANASWIESLADWRNLTSVPRITDDTTAMGEMLPAVFLYKDPVKNLDYFDVYSPHGLSTFGLSQTTDNGNPFQLITLSVTSHVNPPAENSNPSPDSDSGSTAGVGAGAGKITVPTATPIPTPTKALPDPGKSAKVYTNANGVVTQATRLQSTDGRALVSIEEGVVAKDASGKPLAEITLKALPSGNIPVVPSGSAFTFAGMAYEIGPDGATFVPPISLTFTLPQAQWGQDYTVKFFDQKSGTWQDLPTTFDATAGRVTAQVTHLRAFALFTEPRAAPPTPAATPVPVPATPQVNTQPPTTAVSIFTSMLGWAAGLVMNNIVILVAIIFLVIALYLVKRGRFPGSGR